MAEEVEVNIYGETFRVAADNVSPEHIGRLADLVEQQIQSIPQTRQSSRFRIAVLAALNIANDFLKLQDQLDQLQHEYDQSAQRLHDKTEHLLSLLQQQVTDD